MHYNNLFNRYIIVGLAGNLIGLITYNILFFYFPLNEYKIISVWILAYLIGVIQQHHLHRKWTFNDEGKSYLKTLIGAYKAYSIGMIISTVVNYFLLSELEINLQVAWFISVGVSVVTNFLFLKTVFRTKL